MCIRDRYWITRNILPSSIFFFRFLLSYCWVCFNAAVFQRLSSVDSVSVQDLLLWDLFLLSVLLERHLTICLAPRSVRLNYLGWPYSPMTVIFHPAQSFNQNLLLSFMTVLPLYLNKIAVFVDTCQKSSLWESRDSASERWQLWYCYVQPHGPIPQQKAGSSNLLP